MTYRVPRRAAQAEIEVKRSRFLCTLERVEDEQSARALVDRLRREHWDARHHCSAFVVGTPPVPVERSSDDGEPAGTAGAPMLEVLRGAGLSDTAVVVTRWFGGTLLGAGGLVRAYGDAVRAAVARAGLLERRLRSEVEVDLDHAEAGRVEDATALYDWLVGLANDVGLYAEEYDPGTGRMVGNFPQAFSHLTLTQAAFALARHAADT